MDIEFGLKVIAVIAVVVIFTALPFIIGCFISAGKRKERRNQK